MEESTKCLKNRRLYFAVISPLIVAFAKYESGLAIGWSSILPKMQMDNSTSFEVTDNDVKWLISIRGITGMVCTLITGPLIAYLGPRRTLIWLLIPSATAWLAMAFTPYISLLYLGRAVQSSIVTMYSPLVPLLISEYSDPKIRGLMMSMEEITVSIGSLVIYIMAQELYWVTSTALCAVMPGILDLLCFFLPESPFWLVRNGQLEKAEKSITKLRFSKAQAAVELHNMVVAAKSTKQSIIMDQIRLLKHSKNYRPTLLLLAILTLRELGGQFVVFSYTVYIFREAGVQTDPFICTILVGTARTVTTIISALLMDTAGRRPLLIGTTFLCSLAALTCGIFLLFDLPGASWVPFAAFLMYVASYGFGLGPIPWGLLGEMLPTPVRSIAGPICTFGYSLSTFVLGYSFPEMIDLMGIGPTFLFFAASLLLLSIILFFKFPETKGKSLSDLESVFGRKSKNEHSCHM